METMLSYIDFCRLGITYNLQSLTRSSRDDRGAVSSEMAVLIGMMVVIAGAVGYIFMQKAEANANNIPDSVQVTVSVPAAR